MPHLRMRAIKSEHVQALSETLLPELAQAINTDEENFTYPIIEVHWFPRPQEVQDKVAKLITEKVKILINDDVIVIFTKLEKESYYENGKHF